VGSNQLMVGYSPFDTPHHNPIYPFNELYDKSVNLIEATNESIKKCDLIVLWGGDDITPMFYDEQRIPNGGPSKPSDRDLFERELIMRASEFGIPIVGVCRGAQLLCAVAGGKLVQHVNGHMSDHMITTSDGKVFTISSSHHQMMYPYGLTNHELLAWSNSSLSSVYLPETASYCSELEKRHVKEPEVVFFNDLNALAVQCHPEWHPLKDPFNQWMFDIMLERFFE
jgi:gamma-glutamyl-gamma-aminobutyrate hydrolase PuuD